MRVLRVGSFGGGVVLEGGADQRRITELLEADAYEIATRGALVAASDATDYVTVNDYGTTPAPLRRVYAIIPVVRDGTPVLFVVGEGENQSNGPAYQFWYCTRVGSSTPVTPLVDNALRSAVQNYGTGTLVPALDEGVVVTVAPFAGIYEWRDGVASTVRDRFLLVNFGAREGMAAREAPGMYVIALGGGIIFPGIFPIGRFASLGTGPFAVDVASGTNGKQLYFRGITAYNNHVFGWGFDDADSASGDGDTRVMFSNLGDPLTWGNDNVAAVGTNRAFSDSDAIVLGDAGERIRAALAWNGRLFFATNRGLHFIAGYGRDSFVTNGATPVMNAENVLGPNCLIEGPDRAMYGVGDNGLWRFTGGGVPTILGEKLRDFTGASNGWWDLIWSDPAAGGNSYPWVTNQDLVWMACDYEQQQVLIGIPFCDATAGEGQGNDTVVIKYHVRTGGFTRQVFPGIAYTAPGYFRRELAAPVSRFLGTATAGEVTVQRYAYRPDDVTPPVMPATLPRVTFGEYAPFGPEGHGVVPRLYLTLAWQDATALPLVFACTEQVDGVTVTNFTLTVGPTAPGAPADGDVWVDTAQASTDLGNGTAATGIPAAGGYLAYLRNDSAWTLLPGLGAIGIRVTIPLPMVRRQGTRLTFEVACTAAAGRFSIEGLGLGVGAGEAAA